MYSLASRKAERKNMLTNLFECQWICQSSASFIGDQLDLSHVQFRRFGRECCPAALA